jgi:alkyldihydroxyacetonephosphate synthase
VRDLLGQALGARTEPEAAVAVDDVRLGAPRLAGAAREALAAAVGPEHVHQDRAARLRHAGGQSYLDLVRRRGGDAEDAPDAVVAPTSHDEVLAVLRACAAHDVAVVPFGGGTSVVGGVAPERGGHAAAVALDLARMDRMTELDELSLVARLEPGLTAPRAEALLNERGYTLGHFPQSFERATIGGFAATRSSGQASSGYGRFDELVLALRVATPEGTLELGRAPASAAGPDLRALFVGSEGALGVITEVSVMVRPLPAERRYEGWHLPSFAAGAGALRELAQARVLPDVLRLSDEAESALGGALGGEGGLEGGCLVITGVEGDPGDVAYRHARTDAALERAGGRSLGAGPGEHWRDGRYRAPALRDDLLELGVLAETLETATTWSRLEALHEDVAAALRDALEGASPLVLCHVSHVYPAGASLYFTVIARRDEEDPAGQWLAAKRAAGDAIAAAGATITHHHAIGLDHRAWMQAEVGELGLEALRAVKARLDPAGVLNPGKLLPPR